jgi:coproporphyrinogen III oxidase
MYREDAWKYGKGEGGGITRVWEGEDDDPIEKGGVNFSGISGADLPGDASMS